MTTTQELLESSFELNLSNYGPEDVERLNDWAINAYRALEALQTDVVRLNMALHGYQVAIEIMEELLKDRVALAMEVERLKAAGAVDCGHRPPCTECSDYAAPIPQPPAPSDTAITYMTGYSDGREWAGATNQAQPSQALELSDDEIDALLPTITLKGLDPKQQVWLTQKKDAIAFARAIIAAINAKGQPNG